MTDRRRNQWSRGPDEGTPAEEIQLGAVIDYRPGWRMVVTHTSVVTLLTVKRRMLHGWILTAPPAKQQPKITAGPRSGQPLYRVGAAAEVMTTARRRIIVHEQRPHTPGRCPCYAHTPADDHFAPPRPWEATPLP